MTYATKRARDEALADALRVANDALGAELPTAQAIAIIHAIKRLREDAPLVTGNEPRIDYLTRVQEAARAQWLADPAHESPGFTAAASTSTPLGPLHVVTWRREWQGARGTREAWAGEYTLNGEPITVAEIKAAGLARRPTSRNRQRAKP